MAGSKRLRGGPAGLAGPALHPAARHEALLLQTTQVHRAQVLSGRPCMPQGIARNSTLSG